VALWVGVWVVGGLDLRRFGFDQGEVYVRCLGRVDLRSVSLLKNIWPSPRVVALDAAHRDDAVCACGLGVCHQELQLADLLMEFLTVGFVVNGRGKGGGGAMRVVCQLPADGGQGPSSCVRSVTCTTINMSHLVAAHLHPRQIVPLDPDLDALWDAGGREAVDGGGEDAQVVPLLGLLGRRWSDAYIVEVVWVLPIRQADRVNRQRSVRFKTAARASNIVAPRTPRWRPI
jgi:hypothetical protein